MYICLCWSKGGEENDFLDPIFGSNHSGNRLHTRVHIAFSLSWLVVSLPKEVMSLVSKDEALKMLLPKLPELKKSVEMELKMTKTDKEDAKRAIDENRYEDSDWFIPYYYNGNKGFTKCCAQYNDYNGWGCSKKPCSLRHECMLCGKDDHGAFFLNASLYPKCPIYAKICEEINLLDKEDLTFEGLKHFFTQKRQIDERESLVSSAPLISEWGTRPEKQETREESNLSEDSDDDGPIEIERWDDIGVNEIDETYGYQRIQFKTSPYLAQNEMNTVVLGTLSIHGIKTEVAVKFCRLDPSNKTHWDTAARWFKTEFSCLKKLRNKAANPECFVQLLSEELYKSNIYNYFFCILELCDMHLGHFVGDVTNKELINLQLQQQFTRDIFLAYKGMHLLKIAHRDVKPQNILVKRVGSRFQIRVCDFQGSKMGSTLTTRIGTHVKEESEGNGPRACWYSPEVYFKADKDKYTKEADLWPLGGVIAFIVSKGKILFDSVSTIEEAAKDVKKLQIRLKNVVDLPLARHLIGELCKGTPSERLSLKYALWHPFLWTPKQLIEILDGLVVWCRSNVHNSESQEMNSHYEWIAAMDKVFNGPNWASEGELEDTLLSFCSFLVQFFRKLKNLEDHQEKVIYKISSLEELEDFFPRVFELLKHLLQLDKIPPFMKKMNLSGDIVQ